MILAAEKNVERQLYYRLLWEIGASQSDAAELTAANIEVESNTLSYFRKKTGEHAQLAISARLRALLDQLPKRGPLFPTIATCPVNVRAADFFYLCKRLKIEGVTLHSYRYAGRSGPNLVVTPSVSHSKHSVITVKPCIVPMRAGPRSLFRRWKITRTGPRCRSFCQQPWRRSVQQANATPLTGVALGL